jgi:hypothetical protein
VTDFTGLARGGALEARNPYRVVATPKEPQELAAGLYYVGRDRRCSLVGAVTLLLLERGEDSSANTLLKRTIV